MMLRASPALRALSLLLAALLGGCALGPDFQRPAAPDQAGYTREAPQSADGAQRFSQDASLPADWWKLFGSLALDQLVEQALAHSPTVDAAEAGLRQSQYTLRAGYGVFYPLVGAEAAAARERTAPVVDGAATPSTVFKLLTLSASVSYTLDLFGHDRRTVEGLHAQVDYQRNQRRAAYLSLSSNVVNTAIAWTAYAEQVQETEQQLAALQAQARELDVQYQAGTAAYSLVLAQQQAVASLQAQLAALRQRESQSEHLLASLQGISPAQLKLPTLALNQLRLPADLPLSLPSQLVRQRPDVLAAEAQMHGASANVGVATAAMFPSFSLTAGYGIAGPNLGNLPAANGHFWSVGPSVNLPLFQGGAGWFGRKAAQQALLQAEAGYRQTVLNAFEQVADALKGLEHDAQQVQAQTAARQAAQQALALLRVNESTGLAAHSDVLAGEIMLHQTQLAWLQALAQRQQDTVALFAALGGGWWNPLDADSAGAAP